MNHADYLPKKKKQLLKEVLKKTEIEQWREIDE